MDKQQPSAGEEQMSRQQYREQLQQQLYKQQSPEQGPVSRRQYESDQQASSDEAKVGILKRKLNIAIIALVLAIIVVYLILFFVG